ncbi:MAG: hypothetical protein RL754_476 [Bacteroidota bacterium]|jgi:tRNA G18 (ribose-2'-O)-methylase SpoU
MRKLRNNELGRLTAEEYQKSKKTPLVLVSDNVRSMHNIGSLFRTADCFRVEHFYLCGMSPVPGHPEIEKTALGATESVPWSHHENTIDLLTQLKSEGYTIAALEQAEGSFKLHEYQAYGPTALVLGHEVIGVAQDVVEAADHVIEIVQYGTKHSLNVSVSAGLAIYELHKQLSAK